MSSLKPPGPSLLAGCLLAAAPFFTSTALVDTLNAQTEITFIDGQTRATALDTTAPNDPTTLTLVSGAATQSGVISGSGAVNKTGDGTLTLSAANTYSGATTIGAGTLALLGTYQSPAFSISSGATLEINTTATTDYAATTFSGAGTLRKTGGGVAFWGAGATTFALGSGSLIDVQGGALYGGSFGNDVWTNNRSDLNVASGATFRGVEANVRVDALTGSGTIRSGYNSAGYTAFTFGVDNGSGMFSGVLAHTDATNNTAHFVKAGTGTQILAGANTFTGSLTVNAGTLQIGNGGITGSVVSDIANHAALVFNRSDAVTYAGAISGTGSLTQSGTGTLTLSGAHTYSGGSTISAGTLTLGASERLANSGAVTINGGTLALGSFDETVGSFTLSAGSLTGTGTLTASSFAIASPGTISAVLAGSGALTQSGTGITTLTGANTYAGGTTISAGTLQLGNGGSTGSVVGNIANHAALVFNRSDAVTYAGAISGSGSLTQTGTGTLTLSGTNTYSGPTAVSAGTLQFANKTALYNNTPANWTAANLTVGSGATAAFNVGGSGEFSSSDIATLAALGSATGGFQSGSTLALDTTGGSGFFTLSTPIGNPNGGEHALSLTKLGTGTLSLTGANTYTGATTISSGVLQFGTANVLSDATAVTVNSGATLFAAYSDTIGSLAGAGTLTIYNNATLAVGADNTSTTFSGNSSSAGGSVFAKTGAGTLILTGTHTLPGSNGNHLAIQAGTLQIGDGGTTGIVNGPITNDSALVFNRSNDLSLFSRISGSGSVTQQGSGNVTLNDPSTYAGVTTVNAGTLTLGNSIYSNGTLAGSVVVNSGGTLFTKGQNVFGNDVSSLVQLTINDGGLVTSAGFGRYNRIANLNLNGGELRGESGDAYIGAFLLTDTVTVGGSSASRITSNNIGDATISLGAYLGSGITTFAVADVTGSTAADLTISAILRNAYLNYQDGPIGGLTKTGAGTLVLSAANTYTGATTISDGTLALGASNAGFAGSALTVSSGTTFDLADFSGSIGSLTGAGSVTLGSGTLTTGGDNNSTTFDGAISGTGGLTKTGTGNFTLAGANTYSGTTTIAQGTLTLGAADALPSGGTLNLASEATLDLGGFSTAFGSLSGTGNYALSSGAILTIGSDNTSTTFFGSVSDTGSLTKVGSGTLTLAGDNSFTGGTTVNAGVLALSGAGNSTRVSNTTINAGATLRLLENNQIGTSTITVNGGTLDFGNHTDYFATLVMSNAGSVLGSGSFTLENPGTSHLSATGGGNAGTIVANIGITSQYGYGGNANRTLEIDTPAATSLTISGGIRDTLEGAARVGSLSKTGAGTLLLSGTNTYRGDTTVSAGTLVFGASNALSAGSTVNVTAGALVDLAGFSGTLGGIAGAGDITLGSATLTAGANNSSTAFTGVLSGTGGLIKNGTGTLVLSGANTYSGPTTVAAGTLQFANQSSLYNHTPASWTAANLTVSSGATAAFNVGGAGEFTAAEIATIATLSSPTGGFQSGSTLALDLANDLTLTSAITAPVAFTKLGAGSLTLAGANTYTGATTVSAGTLVLGAENALPTGSALTVAAGATFDFGGYAMTPASFTGDGTFILGSVTLAFDGDDNDTAITANLAGAAGITKDGTGTLTLAGQNTYAGGTTVSGGTVYFTQRSALAGGNLAGLTTDNFIVNSGATVAFNVGGPGEFTAADIGVVGSLSSATGGLRSGSTLALTVTNDTTLTSPITAPVGLVQSGSGKRLTLAAANTYTGSTTISGSTILALGADNALPTSTAVIVNGGLLDLGGFSATVGSLSGNGYLHLADGTLTHGGNNASTLLSGYFFGTGGLTKTGSGTFELYGQGDYLGATTVNGGTLLLSAHLYGLGYNPGDVVVNSGGTLVLQFSDILGDHFTDSLVRVTINAGGTLTNGHAYGDSYNSLTDLTLNGGTLNSSGNTDGTFSAFQLKGTVTVGGTTPSLISSSIGAANAEIQLGNNTAGGAMTFAVANVTGDSAPDLTISAVLQDDRDANWDAVASGLTKTGLGTLTLSGANTYTGATTVFAGTLRVNGSLANTAVTVAAGATLGGSGRIDGFTTLANGAHLAPGNSPGTLTFTGGLALEAGMFLDFELGTSSDLILVTGGTLSGPSSATITVNLTDSGGFTAGTYTLIDATGATLSGIGATSFDLGTTIAGYTYAFAQNGNLFQLTATSAVPEPSTCATILGTVALAFVACRRRRRASSVSPPPQTR